MKDLVGDVLNDTYICTISKDNKEKNDGDVEVSNPVTTPKTGTTESFEISVPILTSISHLCDKSDDDTPDSVVIWIHKESVIVKIETERSKQKTK